MAAVLANYLQGRPADQPVWGGTWARDKRGAAMLRRDLESAGIPYTVEGLNDPPLVPSDGAENAQTNVTPLRLTGTDGAVGESAAPKSVPKSVVTHRIGLHSSALSFTSDDDGKASDESPQVLEMKQPDAVLHQVASVCSSEDDGTRTRNHRIDSPVL